MTEDQPQIIPLSEVILRPDLYLEQAELAFNNYIKELKLPPDYYTTHPHWELCGLPYLTPTENQELLRLHFFHRIAWDYMN